MAVKPPAERPEPISSRINSVSSQFSDGGQAVSPSARSSLSSWSEEPAHSNMDISTGHMILVSQTHFFITIQTTWGLDQLPPVSLDLCSDVYRYLPLWHYLNKKYVLTRDSGVWQWFRFLFANVQTSEDLFFWKSHLHRGSLRVRQSELQVSDCPVWQEDQLIQTSRFWHWWRTLSFSPLQAASLSWWLGFCCISCQL